MGGGCRAKLENANLQKYPLDRKINSNRKMKKQKHQNEKNFPGKKS